MDCSSQILFIFFFFSSRRRHTRFDCDWSSDVCSSDLFADYETKILQVTNLINEAQSAKEQGNTQLEEQKSVQAREVVIAARSEERRVGKECRSRWSAYH